MKITNVETFLVGTKWRNWLFVKLSTDEGIVGVGEASLGGMEKAVESAIHEFKRRIVLGSSPFDIENMWRRVYRDEWYGGPVHLAALSGIEIACWDVIGKALGQPVYNLLGGRCRDKLRVYANGWYVGERTPENYGRQARKVVEKGYTALKFDPFGTAGREMSREAKIKSIDLVAAVRDAVGPDVEIFIEVHGRFSPMTAIEIGRALEPYRPGWYEEPIAPDNDEAMALVARSVNIPIATGERLYTRFAYRRLFELQAASIIQPDILHTGGILETKKIAAMADTYHMTVAPHNAMGPVSTAVAVQVDACLPNFYIQECFDEFDVPWRNELVKGVPEIKNGYITIPDRPGLGIELDEEAIKAHPYVEDAFFNMWDDGWEKEFF
ncbi:MAG: galactonate dehydratase [Steroidobacteraceae bacterium]